LVTIAEQVEAAGWDGVIISDHVLIGAHTDLYPWGPFPFGPEAPWLEPLTVLTAIAARTTTIELTTGILIVPLRPAALLAKTVATLDRLSGGRLVLGVGTGWQREEFEAQGLDHADRGALLTDFIGACRALWTEAPVAFESPSVRFEQVWSEPRPTHPGGPPVLFSGTLTPRNVRRIVELGDGWIPIMGATRDDIAAGVEVLRDAYRAAGRAPEALEVRASLGRPPSGPLDPDALLANTDDLLSIGVTELSLHGPSLAREPRDLAGPLDAIGAAWRSRTA
jgi:probable F420-dependent oxidoreductase